MKFYSEKTVKQVRKARYKGLSIKKLEEKFKIPDSTISKWIRDIPSNHISFKKARSFEKNEKNKYRNIFHYIKLTKNISKILCSLLYWCEGSKYPASNTLTFSNSDPDLVFCFLYLLRNAFKIKEKKLKIHLQIHTTHNFKKIKTFWSNLLLVSPHNFYKPTVTKPTKSMKRTDYLGTCTVKYHDVRILLQIMGIYEKIAKKWRHG